MEIKLVINKYPLQCKLCHSDIKSFYTNGKLFEWNESNFQIESVVQLKILYVPLIPLTKVMWCKETPNSHFTPGYAWRVNSW